MTRDLQALIAYLDSRFAMPFDWDGNCCVKFVLGGVEAQTGKRPALAHDWTTRIGAMRAIHAFGGIEAETDRLFHRIEPARAMRGDIAGYDHPEFGTALALFEGQTIVGPGERRAMRLHRQIVTRAWSIFP